MKVIYEKYVNATKLFPILFEDVNGEDIDNIEQAAMYGDYKTAENELDRFDEPNERQILKVIMTYSF